MSRRALSIPVLAAACALVLAGCQWSGGTTRVVDDSGRCTEITVPSVDLRPATEPTTLPGVRLAPCTPPTTTTPPPTTTTPPTTTPPPAALGPATNVTVTPLDGQARLSWELPATGQVDGYRVGRDGTDTRGTAAWQTVDPASARSRTFDLLKAGATYNVFVEPIYVGGEVGARVTLQVTPTAPPTTPPTTTTPPPPTTTPTTPLPAGGGTSAAERFGWGTPNGGDEFNTGVRPGSTWGMYDGPGHAGNGRRTPDAFSIVSVDGAGVLRVHGDARGNSGGMAYRSGQFRGKWEARVRVTTGDPDYHPVLILWPNAEDFPVGGEVDYMEIFDRDEVNFFLHYSAQNRQTHGSRAIDTTQWHNYAVTWDASCIRGYVDAAQFFEDCNRSHLPPRTMHATIQLDGFGGTGPYTPSDMYVDWIRQYAP